MTRRTPSDRRLRAWVWRAILLLLVLELGLARLGRPGPDRMTRRRHDLVDIAGEIRHETEAAYLFFDGSREVWLPKSQVHWDAEDRILTCPEWLATEKDLL